MTKWQNKSFGCLLETNIVVGALFYGRDFRRIDRGQKWSLNVVLIDILVQMWTLPFFHICT